MIWIDRKDADGNDVGYKVFQCECCGEYRSVYARVADWLVWNHGKTKRSVESVFRGMRPKDMAFVKTGICPKCCESSFGGRNENK